MPSTLRNALVWCLLVLVPAGWIAVPALQQQHAQAQSHDPGEEPTLAVGAVTVLQGKLMVNLAPMSLEADDPLGTRPAARLAAAMLLAQAGATERAESQWKQAMDAKSGAPDAELGDLVHRVIVAWPQAQGGQRPVSEGVLDDAQWNLLRRRMGWFGDLARADFTGDAAAVQLAYGGKQTLMLVMMLATLWFLGAGLVGLAALITLVVMAARGRLSGGITTMPRTQSILGETFVVWMMLFLGMHELVGRLADRAEPSAARVWVVVGMGFVSLVALAWARWRGLSWSEVRDATGMRFQGGPLRLAWMSGVSYACALPCMGVGIVLGMQLTRLLGDRSMEDMSHPVQELLPSAGGAMRLALFALASVGAPIVEEIAFRGLLYGHVRQQSARWPRALSIAFAMLFSATVFAAIHPQGLLAVPALAGVSLGFCITREWSGSVMPGMVAHGLHNGLLLALNLALQAG